MARRTMVRRSQRHGHVTTLRRRVAAMMAQLQRAGMRQVRTLEQQIASLNRQRDALLAEIGIGTAPKDQRGALTSPRGGRGRGRVDWDRVFVKLPKTSFQAATVKKLVPHASSGTVSLRLSSWVGQKKLRRTGTRRGARYTRVA